MVEKPDVRFNETIFPFKDWVNEDTIFESDGSSDESLSDEDSLTSGEGLLDDLDPEDVGDVYTPSSESEEEQPRTVATRSCSWQLLKSLTHWILNSETT